MSCAFLKVRKTDLAASCCGLLGGCLSGWKERESSLYDRWICSWLAPGERFKIAYGSEFED